MYILNTTYLFHINFSYEVFSATENTDFNNQIGSMWKLKYNSVAFCMEIMLEEEAFIII